MRIDLPCCDFKNCKFQFDGNCTDRARHEKCEYAGIVRKLYEVPDTDVGDTISRRAAIDALWKALYEYEDKTEKQFQDSDELDVSEWMLHRIFVQKMSDIDRKTILDLPSAQPEARWIPVTERLPEVGDRVLVTIPLVYGYPWIRIVWYGTPMFENKVCFYESDSEWGDYELSGVTAWMPLPTAYERSEDGSQN